MKPQTAVARARKLYRLEAHNNPDGETSWLVLDKSNSGAGVYGDEAKGRDHYERVIMFHALKLLDAEHDWHAYDWHSLSGSAENRVANMLAWRDQRDNGAAEQSSFQALINLVLGSRPR